MPNGTEITITHKENINYKKEVIVNFAAGGFAGFLTGLAVSPLESMKVHYQVTPPGQRKPFSPIVLKHTAKSILPFSCVFSVVCAVELSINEQVRKEYGTYPGLAASALTGASLLSFADHILYRKQLGEPTVQAIKDMYRSKTCFTGFVPMCGREFLFVGSIIHLGPFISAYFQKDKEKQNWLHRFTGQIAAGMLVNTFSHPFDVTARELQKQLKENPKQSPNLSKAVSFLAKNPASFFRGLPPRLLLATYGQGLINEFYMQAKSKINQ